MTVDVEIVLQNADVGVVLNQLGIDWDRRNSKRGHELYFACPTNNHSDDPTKKRCSVAELGKYKGQFNCWACDFHGNLIHLIRFMHNCNFKQALSFLENQFGSAELLGIDALNFRLRMSKPEYDVKGSLKTFDLPRDYTPILEVNTDATHHARRWLQDERFITPAAMERFEVGVSSIGEHGLMIVIPIRFKGDLNSIFYAQPFKGGLKRYPKNSPQGHILFNYDRCRESDSYIMVESVLDVITIWSITGCDAMACFTNMISDEQIDLIRGFEEHGVMPDLDGKRGWDLVQRMVPHIGKGLWLYFVPLGKDPGDCDVHEITNAIHQRVRYCDYESAQWPLARQRVIPKITRVEKK